MLRLLTRSTCRNLIDHLPIDFQQPVTSGRKAPVGACLVALFLGELLMEADSKAELLGGPHGEANVGSGGSSIFLRQRAVEGALQRDRLLSPRLHTDANALGAALLLRFAPREIGTQPKLRRGLRDHSHACCGDRAADIRPLAAG